MHVLNKHHFFAGTDQERLADLQEMMNNDDVKAIICARGGYGTIRFIDQIDLSAFRKHPKWIAGFSDITVLHAFLQQNGIESLHAPMPRNFKPYGQPDPGYDSLILALTGNLTNYHTPTHHLNRKGKARGVFWGGNLSIIVSLMGSPLQPDFRDKILFIEDLNEHYYHLDRMMMTLKISGALANLKGLIVGGLTGMKDTAPPFGMPPEEIIAHHVQAYDYPVLFNFPAGHIQENMAIYLGRTIEIEVTGEGIASIRY